MGGIPIDIIICAIIAALIFYKYTSVLGSKDDTNDSKTNDLESPAYSGKVILFPKAKQLEEPQEPTTLTLDQTLEFIENKASDFDKTEFIHGSKIAFKLIITAFFTGNMSTVTSFLSSTVARKFKSAINDRDHGIELKLETLDHVQIVEASLTGSIAEITVQFISTQTLTQNGSSATTEQVSDLWVFSKNIYNNDPVWSVTDITASPADTSEHG